MLFIAGAFGMALGLLLLLGLAKTQTDGDALRGLAIGSLLIYLGAKLAFG